MTKGDELFRQAVGKEANLQGADDLAEAEKLYMAAAAEFKLEGKRLNKAICYSSCGSMYRAAGEFNRAEEMYLKALGLAAQAPDSALNQANCLTFMDILYECAVNDPEQADNLFKKIIKFHTDVPGAIPKERVKAWLIAADRYRDADPARWIRAEKLYESAAEASEEASQKAYAFSSHGLALDMQGKHPEAILSFNQAMLLYQTIPGTELQQADCLLNLGVACGTGRDYPKAEEYLRKALKLYENLPDNNWGQASCMLNLGNIMKSNKNNDKAAACWKSALSLLRHVPDTEEQQLMLEKMLKEL